MNGQILILGAAALLTAAIPGLGQGGTGVLYVDGKEVDRQSMEHGTPITFAEEETFDVGFDTRTGVALNGSATVIGRAILTALLIRTSCITTGTTGASQT